MHNSFLSYEGFKYLKWALFLSVVAIGLYIWDQPLGPANGGTWLGYGLGGLGATLIAWLAWFGIRKRQYGKGSVGLQAWLSAHVYLSLALIFIATLHTGFQFGINIHTLAYTLMMVVILSGFFGAFAYAMVPERMTRNRDGVMLSDMMLQIADIDQKLRGLCVGLDKSTTDPILKACDKTRIGGGAMKQLSGEDAGCPSNAALRALTGRKGQGEEADAIAQMASLLSRKCELLARARRDVRYQALMRVWLFIHLPFTFALLVALTTHVVSVFFYW